MELFIKIQPEDEKSFFPAECNVCGFTDSSGNFSGGGPIAGTGDYDDMYCPCCGSWDVDECENEISASAIIDRYKKAYNTIKNLNEKLMTIHYDSHALGYIEEQNTLLRKELEECKTKLHA